VARSPTGHNMTGPIEAMFLENRVDLLSDAEAL
jgi:hypothetical protein